MKVPKIHKLKVWSAFYTELETEAKKFEIRLNDRDYQVNDYLELFPFDPIKDEPVRNGRQIAKVTYILDDAYKFGVREGYVIMSLKYWKEFSNEEKLVFRLLEGGIIDDSIFKDFKSKSKQV